MHKLHAASVSVDSSVALDFHLTNSFEILVELFEGKMLMSDFVKNELPNTMDLRGTTIVPLAQTAEWELLEKLKKEKRGLGLGEIGAIVVAKTHDAVLLTNDKPARNAIQGMEIEVAGSIAVLEYAVESGRMQSEAAVELLKEMIQQGARISKDLVTEFEEKMRIKKMPDVRGASVPVAESVVATRDQTSGGNRVMENHQKN